MKLIFISIFYLSVILINPYSISKGKNFLSNSYSEKQAHVLRLKKAGKRKYAFNKAVLSDVIRYLADQSGIDFFDLPANTPEADQVISLNITASPFEALEKVADAHGISLIFDKGTWYIRSSNDSALIARQYEINFNTQEKSSEENAATKLEEDIKKLISNKSSGGISFETSESGTAPADTIKTGNSIGNVGGPAPEPQIIWNSDANTLYVLATRLHHSWIKKYLDDVDKPLNMIAIEVKIVTMKSDPRVAFGIEFNNQSSVGNGLITTGFGFSPEDSIGTPTPTAILNYEQTNLILNAAYEKSSAKSVSFPRMVTMDNRTVEFDSNITEPLGSTQTTVSDGVITSETKITTIDVGTKIKVTPKIFNNNMVKLNIDISISDVIDRKNIGGEIHPVTTNQDYSSPLNVRDRHTVAISGLDTARVQNREKGIPVLSKIPIVGKIFQNKSNNSLREHTMILITPSIIDSTISSTGISLHPRSSNIDKDSLIDLKPLLKDLSIQDEETITNEDLYKSTNKANRFKSHSLKNDIINTYPVNESYIKSGGRVRKPSQINKKTIRKYPIKNQRINAAIPPMPKKLGSNRKNKEKNNLEIVVASVTPSPSPSLTVEVLDNKYLNEISIMEEKLIFLSNKLNISSQEINIAKDIIKKSSSLINKIEDKMEKSKPNDSSNSFKNELKSKWWDLIRIKSKASKILKKLK